MIEEPKIIKTHQILHGERPFKSKSVPQLGLEGQMIRTMSQIIPRPLLTSFDVTGAKSERQLQ